MSPVQTTAPFSRPNQVSAQSCLSPQALTWLPPPQRSSCRPQPWRMQGQEYSTAMRNAETGIPVATRSNTRNTLKRKENYPVWLPDRECRRVGEQPQLQVAPPALLGLRHSWGESPGCMFTLILFTCSYPAVLQSLHHLHKLCLIQSV